MGQEIVSKIALVCSDMWEPYLKAYPRELLQRRGDSRSQHAELDELPLDSEITKGPHVAALSSERGNYKGRKKQE